MKKSSKYYKIPKPNALKMATQYGSIQKLINNSIKKFNHDHPEWKIPHEAFRSLSKRIEGDLKEEFCRLLSERYIVDFIIDNPKIAWKLLNTQGSFRKLITDKICEFY